MPTNREPRREQSSGTRKTMPSTPSSTRTLVPPEKNEADDTFCDRSSPAEEDNYLLAKTAAGPARERASRGNSGRRVSGSLSLPAGYNGRPSVRTNRVGRGLSLNRSQCGGCSTKYDTPSLKSSGLRAIPRLTLHGGFETRRRRQNPAGRGGQVGWPVRARRRGCDSSSTATRGERTLPLQPTTTATGDDDRYGRLQRNEKRRLS